jgi:hypothetical protein
MDVVMEQVVEFQGRYLIGDIKINRAISTVCYLVFVVEGIESNRSQAITIQSARRDTVFRTSVVEIVVTMAAILFVLVMNIGYGQMWLTVVALLLTVFEFFTIQQSDKGLLYQVIAFVTMALLIIINGHLMIKEFKVGTDAHFVDVKKNVFRAYTAQQLFNARPREVKTLTFAEKVLQNSKSERAPTKPTFVHFKARSLGAKVCSILRTFDSEYNGQLPITDAFYYPPRFLAAVLLGFLAFLYFCLSVINFVFSLLNRYSMLI